MNVFVSARTKTMETNPVMVRSVRFSLNKWDVLRCRLWVAAHNRKLVAIAFLTCILVSALTCHVPAGASSPLLYGAIYFVVMTAFMIVLNVVFQIVIQSFMVVANKNRGVVGEHEFTIQD